MTERAGSHPSTCPATPPRSPALSAYRVAKDIGVSLPTVNDIVRRRRAVTAEMALRFARYFGTSAELWQNLQAQYDLEVATLKIGATVARHIRPFAQPPTAEPTRRRAAA